MKNRLSLPYRGWIIWGIGKRKLYLLSLLSILILVFICLEYNYNPLTDQMIQMNLDGRKTDKKDNNIQSIPSSDNLIKPTKIPAVVNFLNQQDTILSSNLPENSNIYYRAIKDPYIPEQRLIHLDLKGAPPKIQYIKEIFKLIKKLGATGVLIEYEDMFPWRNNLKELAATNAYTQNDIRDIISLGKFYKLNIIPLVQTFGHLEFALKYKEFQHLREVPNLPQALCPSTNESFKLVQQMIDQVMDLHRGIRYLHIGCDEVFQLGECSRCIKKMKDDLFLSHVTRVAGYIRKRYPYTIPIIWDDMLRHVSVASMEAYNLGQLVEPMVWVYAEDVYRFAPQSVFDKYKMIFPYSWAASAFKGAFGETFYVPNVKRHLQNNLNWLQVMSVEDPKFKKGFRGLVITGWQRYDHFAVLCETLPASIPSLVVNLVAVTHGYANDSLRNIIYEGLSCDSAYLASSSTYNEPEFMNLDMDPFLWDHFSRCSFSGSHFFRLLYRLHSLEREVGDFLHSTKKSRAWLTDYNIRLNFSSTTRIDDLMMDERRLHRQVVSLTQSVADSLKPIFDEHTILEWIEQRLYPIIMDLEKLQNASNVLKSFNVWDKRPLKSPLNLKKFGIYFENSSITSFV